MDLPTAEDKLKEIGQAALLTAWPQLTIQQQHTLLLQIAALDLALFAQQRRFWEQKATSPPLDVQQVQPIRQWADCHDNNPSLQRAGEQLCTLGQVGCLILAAGSGSRLSSSAPKGCYPISVIQDKSLFQLLAEKIGAASRQRSATIPVAVMCSRANLSYVHQFFAAHNSFGLDPHNLFFFAQDNLPLLDECGNLFLDANGHLASGPEGNGTAFYHFLQSGIAEQWQQRGIRFLTLLPIDNPLADPCDAQLLGFHAQHNFSVTLKSIWRSNPRESLGVLATNHQALQIIEYNELPEQLRFQRDHSGHLLFGLANTGLFCFDLATVVAVAAYTAQMPLHFALKAIGQKMAWKGERYIFDLLPWIPNYGILVYPRESCFAPLKNKAGSAGPDGVKAALQQCDRACIAALTGLPAPDFPFELAQQFHYPTPQLRHLWHGKSLTCSGYISA